jgi:hypothetical protein
MYANYSQHPHQPQHHPQQHPAMWAFVPSSIVTPNGVPSSFNGRYLYPPGVSMANRHTPPHRGPVPPTNFVAISPSVPPLPLINHSQLSRASLPDHSHSSMSKGKSPFPSSTTSSVAAPASLSKSKQNEEYEAAEVLLGLTTREDKNHEGSSQASASSSRKDSDASESLSIKKATTTLGHVTDESSIGTASPTPPLMCTEDPSSWYSGCVSLSLPEDDDVLSPLHCFMRKYCVEAFSASAHDVATPRYGKSHGFKVQNCDARAELVLFMLFVMRWNHLLIISWFFLLQVEVGQVGIRCIYCKDLAVGKRPERAVCYPSSLRNIYHSIETWQRRHSLVCTHISPWVRKSIDELMESSKTRAGGRRQYWEDSAKRLGMVDTSRGVRFIRPPGDLGPVQQPQAAAGQCVMKQQNVTGPVVLQEDKDLVTDYLFLLMEQMQTCFFTEEDRTGGRSKIKNISLNFPGYECRHCHGRAGFGRYFPTSVAALSLANSDRNVFNHLQKCRRCPTQIKKELVRLSKEQAQAKNRRGLRKLFFGRIWERMHASPSETSTLADPPAVSAPKAT